MIKGVRLQKIILVTFAEKEVVVTQLNLCSVLTGLIVVVQMLHVEVLWLLAVCGVFVSGSCLGYDVTKVEISEFNFVKATRNIVDYLANRYAEFLS